MIRNFKKKFLSTLSMISPVLNTNITYWYHFKKLPNLKEPRTLNEKLQWLKLNTYADDPLTKQCSDKFAVRDYLIENGHEDKLNELIAVYDSVEEIKWGDLPNKFALKLNFGSQFNIICPNKDLLNIKEAEKKLKKWWKSKFHLIYSEMQYKGTKKKIIVEKYLQPKQGVLPEDYKFYCFNGKAEYVMVCVNRDKGKPEFYFFDRDWKLARLNNWGKEAPNDFTLPKPPQIDEAFSLADQLSTPFPFVRVDFYIIDGKIIFGELTFTPSGAVDPNRLPETDLLFGEMLILPNNR
ncbi:ATP-grasp fold amidoligase family protein [Bhargavaea beijingensis]|uniref:Glycosyl transferase n=1 Tax=Bhargavaea beijingensis TaxID=426756 RepID=A0ABX9ZDK6_9BACL|nr:ATP-grasp fold amidoligase family protein [Bhargavaea beijingensis]RSK33699.1 glycosyl transferase [Bhargavaea beijingensis]